MKRTTLTLLSVVLLAGATFAPPAGVRANNVAQGDPSLVTFSRSVEMAAAHLNSTTKRPDLDSFVQRLALGDELGETHVRFQQRHQGLRVIGGEIITHQTADGSFKNDTVSGIVGYEMNIVPDVSEDYAVSIAQGHLNTTKRALATELVVVSGSYFDSNTPVLAWEAKFRTVDEVSPHVWSIYVDASSLNRGVILVDDAVKTAATAGTGKTLYSGNVTIYTNQVSSTSYQMLDNRAGRRGSANVGNLQGGYNYTTDAQAKTDRFYPRYEGVLMTDADNVWGTNTSSVPTDAADAHFGSAMTYDYYNAVLGRNGIWNDGSGANSRVNYGRKYNNAFWADDAVDTNGQYLFAGMSYGRGDGSTFGPLISLDICGHEMTHGVTTHTANLTYAGESGGLNEAMSDCIGAAVEQYADGGFCDAPAGKPFKYWEIGEQCYTPSGSSTDALRYMYDPAKDTRSKNEWSSSLGSLDVHYSSGPLNLAFYLTSQGGRNPRFVRANNQTEYPTVTGIGVTDAAKIWYRALSVYMSPSTNYAGARTAMLNAASDLFGASSAQYSAVAKAFTNINVK